MMLAPTLNGTGSRVRFSARRRSRALDAALLLTGLAAAAAVLPQGGFEALVGAGAGALIGARTAKGALVESAISGAFAGLFAGALFAGFFHGAVAALATQLL
jgi:hypothetical protein